jgi:hypothetical protein
MAWDWELTIDHQCDNLPEELAATAFICEQTTAQTLPASMSFTLGIIYRLHILGLSSSLGWSHCSDHPAVANVFFQLLHQTHEVITTEPKFPELLDDDTTVMFRCLLTGSRFFMRATLAPVFENSFTTRFLERIRTLVQSGKGGLQMWERNGALDLLLWLLTLAVCGGPPGNTKIRKWFDSAIFWVAQKLHITDEAEFEAAVKSYPWTTRFGLGACRDTWKEVAACADLDLEKLLANSSGR